jgi:hypothetical protein
MREDKEAYRVSNITNIHIPINIIPAVNDRIKRTPKKVATPFPPLKPKNMEFVCPNITKIADKKIKL